MAKKTSENDELVEKALNLLRNLKKEIKFAQKGEMDMEEIIRKVQTDLEKLNITANSIYEQTGMSKEAILEHMQDPENFSKEEWELLEKVRHETEVCKKEILKTVHKESISDMVTHGKHKKGSKKNKKRWLAS